jgi:hypothetical protein
MFYCKAFRDKVTAMILAGNQAMKAAAIIVIIALIMIGCSFIGMVTANPYASYKDYPLKPNTTPPTITIQLPENGRTYNSSSVSYKINIQEPIELLDNNLGPNIIHFGKIHQIVYVIDGKNSCVILNQTNDFYSDTYKQNFTLEGKLYNLSDGEHSVQFKVTCDRYYHDPKVSYDMYFWWDCPPLIYSMETSSNQIQFIISANNSNTSNGIRSQTPSLNNTFAGLVILVSLALIISASIFLYRRHRKTTKSS